MTSETQTPARLTAEQVLSTVGYPGFVRSLFNRSGNPAVDFTHAVLGIATEIHELRTATEKVNALEEGGDLTFYVEALGQVICDHTGLTLDDLFEGDGAEAAFRGLVSMQVGTVQAYTQHLANELLDSAKRWVGYGKVPTSLADEFRRALFLVGMSIRDCGLEDEVRRLELINVKKLLARYNGMVFTAERAVNRDLPAERAVLEGAAAA